MKSPTLAFLQTLHARYAPVMDGKIADYIPELAKANPKGFGICVASRDGHLYEVGDTRQEFTIQSISKALAYGPLHWNQWSARILTRPFFDALDEQRPSLKIGLLAQLARQLSGRLRQANIEISALRS